ncbi:type II and III secretion system protein [Anaerosporomusa subterranea]|uniref:Type II and III secretion system protein n=1 Tax=Anaerosporomusa subterranea TaxID=1794912 RepID=A0A154BSF5_ANASB|nr:secretin N-terminal domain-containing protein [Anaerosporomusa subterranea]KYZ76448.1 type II and III secretion system protein [Anaerosporomusa subterranea]
MYRNDLGRRVAVLLLFFFVLTVGVVPAGAEVPRVTINVTNAEVRDVLTTLTGVGGASIILDDSVVSDSSKGGGRITLQLTNVPVEEAIDMVTKVKGLAYLRQGDIYIIGTQERINKGFESVRIVKIKYAKADDVKKALVLIIPEDRLKVDEANNSLIYTGSAAEALRVEQAIAAIDVQYKQVTLEAQVMAVNKGAAKSLGMEWQWAKLPMVKTDSTTTTNSSDSTDTRDYPGVFQFGRNPEGLRYEFQFQATLNAMINDGDAKILSRPKVTTLDGKQARIMVGDRIPVLVERTENNKTTTTIEYVDAGIKLSYTPRINENGLITAAVRTEVSTPTLVPEMKAYRITTREAETTVRMKDGETIVIGGLIGSDESKQFSKIPGLGDLPILGALFRNTNQTKNETEVIIILKAKIVE